MGWAEFAAAFALFFVSHSVPVRPAIRARLVGLLGARGFTVSYSALSIAVLYWVIVASGRAPYVEIWAWAPWQNTVVLVVMAVVLLVLALAIGRPNPFSFGGAGNDRFDPQRPGIVAVTRHPLLLALGLWAFAHMVPNGDLAHVITFGAFGGFAILGRRIIDRRKQRTMGPAWHVLAGEVVKPMDAVGRAVNKGAMVRIVIAVVLYGLLVWAHPALFGVDPLA